LGKEELNIHQNKVVGPIYTLNRHFVNKFASFSNISIKKKYVTKICHDKDFSPSVALLKTILLEGKKIYFLSKDQFKRAEEVATIESFLNHIPHTFFSYLASLQNVAATPDCLEKNVKHLKEFIDNIFYLESEFSAREIFEKREKIQETFEDLKSLDTIWAKCKKEASAKKVKK